MVFPRSIIFSVTGHNILNNKVTEKYSGTAVSINICTNRRTTVFFCRFIIATAFTLLGDYAKIQS